MRLSEQDQIHRLYKYVHKNFQNFNCAWATQVVTKWLKSYLRVHELAQNLALVALALVALDLASALTQAKQKSYHETLSLDLLFPLHLTFRWKKMDINDEILSPVKKWARQDSQQNSFSCRRWMEENQEARSCFFEFLSFVVLSTVKLFSRESFSRITNVCLLSKPLWHQISYYFSFLRFLI